MDTSATEPVPPGVTDMWSHHTHHRSGSWTEDWRGWHANQTTSWRYHRWPTLFYFFLSFCTRLVALATSPRTHTQEEGGHDAAQRVCASPPPPSTSTSISPPLRWPCSPPPRRRPRPTAARTRRRSAPGPW